MNKRRRTCLHNILDDLDKLKNVTDSAVAFPLIEKSHINLRKVADEEEEALDNRPESFRWSTTNDDMGENVTDLNTAADDLELMAAACQDSDIFNYESVKSNIIRIVNTIKRTIHR